MRKRGLNKLEKIKICIKKKYKTISFFFFFFFYLLILAALDLCCCTWAFSRHGERGLLSSGRACASLAVEHNPKVSGLSSCAAQA